MNNYRNGVTPLQKATVYDAYNGQCNKCHINLEGFWRTYRGHRNTLPCIKKDFTITNGVIHHIQPLYDGGTNTIDNYELLCAPCHILYHKQTFPYFLNVISRGAYGSSS